MFVGSWIKSLGTREENFNTKKGDNMDANFMRWFLELANQEYQGNLAVLNANIKHGHRIE